MCNAKPYDKYRTLCVFFSHACSLFIIVFLQVKQDMISKLYRHEASNGTLEGYQTSKHLGNRYRSRQFREKKLLVITLSYLTKLYSNGLITSQDYQSLPAIDNILLDQEVWKGAENSTVREDLRRHYEAIGILERHLRPHKH